MTDERDELDRALSAGLADLAPGEPDAANALTELRPRMRRARTRHRVLQGSAVAAVIVVLGVGAALASPSNKRAQVQVTNPSTVENTVDRSRGTSTTVPDSASTVPNSTTVPDNGGLGVGGTQGAGPDATTPVVTNPSATNAPAVTTPATTPTPTAAPDPGSDHTYASDGGSVKVHFQNARLTLVSYTPVSGFAGTVHMNKADDIEVRFRKGDDETRVRVRVDRGRIVPEIRN